MSFPTLANYKNSFLKTQVSYHILLQGLPWNLLMEIITPLCYLSPLYTTQQLHFWWCLSALSLLPHCWVPLGQGQHLIHYNISKQLFHTNHRWFIDLGAGLWGKNYVFMPKNTAPGNSIVSYVNILPQEIIWATAKDII